MARRTWHLGATMALVITLLAPAAFAQNETNQRDGSRGGDGDWLGQSAVDALELDEGQLARLQEMRAEMRYDLEPIDEEIETLKEELEQAWTSDYPDEEIIFNLNEWLLVMDTLIRERHYDFRFEVLELLSDRQREMLPDEGLEREGRRGRHQDGALPRVGRLLNELDLDEVQQGHAYDLLDEFEYFTALAREMLEALEKELDLSWAEEQPDEDTIYEIDADMDALRWMIREQEIGFLIDLHELLDYDQIELFTQALNPIGRRGRNADDQSES